MKTTNWKAVVEAFKANPRVKHVFMSSGRTLWVTWSNGMLESFRHKTTAMFALEVRGMKPEFEWRVSKEQGGRPGLHDLSES